MADLIDRFSGESLYLVPPRPRVNTHRWIGAQRLYTMGEFTRLQIATEFGIVGNPDEERQATQIANAIDGAGNLTNRIIYIARVEAVVMCLNDGEDRLYHNLDGTVNKTKTFEDLQIVG